jgi:RNA exonuclease 4
MVILGFRPKTPAVKESSIKVAEASKENKCDIPIQQKLKAVNVKQQHKTQQMSTKNQLKPHYTAAAVPVSSNWKRMKSLKVLTADDIKNSGKTLSGKVVNDAEWFGVKDVEEFVAGTEDQILRENVSTASLFPPPPSGISEEKLKQPCKFIALDCEMVGTGLKGFESILARVSVVNFHGNVLLDVYVRPTRKVVDYRTAVSGVTAGHLTASKEDPSMNIFGQPLLSLPQLQEQLVPLLHERIVIGHALHNDFSALLLSSNHPRKLIRDTSRYKPFKALANGRSPSLKMLAAKILGVKIQGSSHDSVDDARIAMLLYRAVKSQWENLVFTRGDRKTMTKSSKKRRHGDDNESDSEPDNDDDNAANIFNPLL